MRAAFFAALLVVASLASAEADACVRSTVPAREGSKKGPCLWWGTRTIGWTPNELGSARIEPDGSEFEAMRRSFQTWSEVQCSDLRFVELSPTSRFDVGFDAEASDNLNLVVFRDRNCRSVAPSADPCWREGGCNNKYNCWEESTETIAVTTTFFSNRTGEIFDGDLELNGEGFEFTTQDGPACAPKQSPTSGRPCVATDLENTVTHEIGHFLGLDHSQVVASTMFRSADLGETHKRSLHPDDLACFCEMYPAGKPTLTCVSPDDELLVGDGCGCGSTGAGASLFAAALALGALLRRPRSSRPGDQAS